MANIKPQNARNVKPSTCQPLPTDDSMGFYPYQRADVRHLRTALDSFRRVLYVLPTGGGKTSVAAAVLLAYVGAGRPVLVLAHRRELVHQMVDRLLVAGVPDVLVGVLMANDPRRRPGALVQVASIDTLRRRAAVPPADLLVIDEAHRATAKSYQAIADRYPEARVLGLTATPYRADGTGLRTAFDHLVSGPSIEDLILDGYLAKPRVWTVPQDQLPQLDGVPTLGGDYELATLSRVTGRRKLVGSIVDHWHRHGANERTVVFAVDVAHAKKIARSFKRAGVAVEHLDGDTPTPERDAILARLRAGTTRVVTNCAVLAEGWDMPPVKCAVLARPTRSLGFFLQMSGRILRPWEGRTPIILDHSGNAVVHGPPQMPRPASLDAVRDVKGEPLGKVCPACNAVVLAGLGECSECGHEFPAAPHAAAADIEEEEGELVEMGPTAKEREAALERIRAVARDRGFGEEWVSLATTEIFREMPNG